MIKSSNEGAPGAETTDQLPERDRLREQLQRAQRMEALGLLASGVAHDFNNLLTIIQVATDFILEYSPGERRINAEAQAIREATRRAAGLTRQLLAFGRNEARPPRAIDLNALVAETANMLRRLIGEDIELVTTLDADVCSVVADPGQLQQVLMNLAVNARDAMPRGGVLHVLTESGAKPREDAMLPSGDHVTLTVADTGLGIEESVQEKIFDPFFTTKPIGRGTGLGLSTVLAIIEQTGGRIAVSSIAGRGTRFTIHLPCGATDAAVPDEAPIAPVRVAPVERATVLLVEDDDAVRGITRRLLAAHGYSVLAAEDGFKAVAIADAFSGCIDALISDIVLPGLSACEIAERLLQRRPGMAVVYVTGYGDDEISRRGLMCAGVRVLEKPFTGNQLDDTVREAISARRGAST